MKNKTKKTLQTFAILFGINLVEYLLITAGIQIFQNEILGLLIINALSVLVLKQFDIIKDD